MNKIKDIWKPSQPPKSLIRSKKIIKDYVPIIEMKIGKEGVEAKVEFLFINGSYILEAKVNNTVEGKSLTFPEKAKIKRTISGSSEEVYLLASKQASINGLGVERSFNKMWNRTLLNLLNKPSPNKTMINLGVVPSTYQSGLYNIKSPSEILREKFNASGITNAKLFAEQSGLSESTILRHLAGTMEMSRDAAFKYAKALGCDPSELIFNPLEIPVWGSVDLQAMKITGNQNVYPGEIIGFAKEEHALCPREIYRPDAKSIRIDQENSFYHNQVAFYYNSNEHIPYENKLVVAGVRLKNSNDEQIRWRYFFGIYKKNKNNKTVDILNPDPEILNDVQEPEYDDDANSYISYLKDLIKDNRYVITDIEPEFVSPIVALVDHSKLQDKENYIKDHNKYYSDAREMDLFNKSPFKKLLLKNYILEKEKEKIKENIENGTLKYSLSDQQMNHEAEKKWSEMNRLLKDLYYSDVLKKINKKIRPDITIKTDEGIKNLEIKKKRGIIAVSENLSQEEIDRINAIDDHLNDVLAGEQDAMENKSA